MLDALGETARACVWRGRDIHYVSRDEQDVAVMGALQAHGGVLGADLIAGLEQLLQTIDGEFEATRLGTSRPCLVIKAVDSSWWEISTDDPAVLTAIRQRFRDVEEVPTDAT